MHWIQPLSWSNIYTVGLEIFSNFMSKPNSINYKNKTKQKNSEACELNWGAGLTRTIFEGQYPMMVDMTALTILNSRAIQWKI